MNSFRLDPLRAPLVRRRWLSLLPLLAPGFALAGPTGGQVIAGQVSIGNPNALTTVVNQTSNTAVVNWQQFNVGGQELVQFVQPSASAAILNRIVGGNPSEILGNLSSNGRVFLINPQGLMFGAGSRVDVGGLMASTLDIKDSDFLAGRYVFAGNGSSGSVLNQGQLRAADGGFIVLAGDSSRNTGLIQAKLGDIVLASGSAMTLDLNGDGLVSYAVNGAALSSAAGVSNAGELLADGGRVLMTADVARGLVSSAVNNTGLVRAAGLAEQEGEIVLLGEGGNVVNSGTLDASSANGKGGDVRVLGDRDVLINGGLIDASGATGGGTVRIGGGIQGGEGLIQSERTFIARNATVRADATRKGDGGDIVAYSRNYSVLAGLLSARGGSQGGAGGFVETSSHGVLTVTRAPEVFGRLVGSPGGQWLIDPHDITIVAGDGYAGINDGNPFVPNSDGSTLGVDLIVNALNNGADVTVTTTGSGNDLGNITLNADLDFDGTGTGSLTLNADHDIIINNQIFDSNLGNADDLSLTLNAGNDVKLLADVKVNAVSISNSAGHLSLGASHVLQATTGFISINSGSAELAGTVDGSSYIFASTYGGDLDGGGLFRSNGSISLYAYGNGNNPTLSVGKVIAGGTVYLSAGGAVEITGDDSQGTGVVVGVDDVDISGTSITSSGNIKVTGDNDVSMSLYANGGNVDVHGSLGVYSNYGGASLDVNAYFGLEDPDDDGIFTPVDNTGNISIDGSVGVRAATYTAPAGSSRPLYGSLIYPPVAAIATLDADGDIRTGQLEIGSYVALAYDLLEDGYGNASTGTLSAAPAELLINQGYHSSAGSVHLAGVQVAGYGESAARISGTGFVQIDNDVLVVDHAAQLTRQFVGLGSDGTEQTLTENRRLGIGTVDINEFQPYVGTFDALQTGGSETSQSFAVDIGGSLTVLGANAQARIEAGTLHIGGDSDGVAVDIQAYAYDAASGLDYKNSLHEIRDESDHLIYSSNVAIAQAEFISTAASTNGQGQPVDGQLFEGSVAVSGREASLRLMAANGGTIRVVDAESESGTVDGSVTVQAAGYVIDGNFYDYGHNQFLNFGGSSNYDRSGNGLLGYFLPPLDAPALGQFSDDAVKPYLHWGAGRLQVTGGSFNADTGLYDDGFAGTFRVAGDLRVSGVGVATGEMQAHTVELSQAVSVTASQGAVYGELGVTTGYLQLAPETIVTEPDSGYGDSGYVVIRNVSGDPSQTITAGRAQPFSAATAAYAGISFEGDDQLTINGPLTVTGLAAEASMEDFDSIVVNGKITIDGRPEGSSPSYYREDVTYIPYGVNPPSAEPIITHSLAIGGRSGLLIDAGVVRLNRGVDIQGTLIAGLIAESPDLRITGDIRIDAATGHIESNDFGFTNGDLVSADLGIAALQIGSADGSAARLVTGNGGYGGLSVTGTTDVQLGGVNLIADGDVLLRATGPNGVISDSMQGIVREFPHPLDYDVPDGFPQGVPVDVGGTSTPAAAPTDTGDEPTLETLLAKVPSACYLDDASQCGSRIATGYGGDIELSAFAVDAAQLQLGAAGSILVASTANQAGAITLGQLDAGGGVRIGHRGNGASASQISVAGITAGGALDLASLGDILAGGDLEGSTVSIRARGSLEGPAEGNLNITSTDGDLDLEVGQLSSLESGSLVLNSAGDLGIQADQLGLNGFDFSAYGGIGISAGDLSLTGGVIDAGSITLTATGTSSEDGLSLAGISLLGDTVEVTGRTVSLAEVEARGHSNSNAANTLVVNGSRGVSVTDSSLVTRSGGEATLSSSAGSVSILRSLLESSTVKLTGNQGVGVNNSTLRTGSTGLVNLGSSAGAINVRLSGVQAPTVRMTAAGTITIEDSSVLVAGLSDAKALTEYPGGLIELKGLGIKLVDSSVHGGDINLLGGAGTVILDGGEIEGNVVRIEANAVTTPGAITIRANGFGARGGILDFGLAAFTFGTGTAPFGTDEGLLARLGEQAPNLLPSSTRPNASFVASQFLELGSIGGTANYLLLDAPDFTFNGEVSGSNNLFLQVIPGIDDQDIAIRNLSFTQFVRTLAIGSENFSGDIGFFDNQQSGGKALVGGSNTNYVLLTEGKVLGASTISTNGQVLVLSNTPPPSEPEIPPEIENAPPGDLVLNRSEFRPSDDQKRNAAEADIVDETLNGSNQIITDDSSTAKQQCDAV